MISVVINADTRPGCGAEVSTTGDFGSGSLQGVRSFDFLIEGVRNKLNFFAGHAVEMILYVDQHELLPSEIVAELGAMVSKGEIQKLVCREHQRSEQRWNERLYLNALQLATGKYVAHFDADCAAFRDPNSDIVNRYVSLLEAGGFGFVCQPTTMTLEQHGMWWASTRFFICKRETLELAEIERCITDDAYRTETYGFCPALEHALARMAMLRGGGNVFYPAADWRDYIVFSWSRYNRSVLGKLNRMPYEAVLDYVMNKCGGLLGPNDLLSQPIG